LIEPELQDVANLAFIGIALLSLIFFLLWRLLRCLGICQESGKASHLATDARRKCDEVWMWVGKVSKPVKTAEQHELVTHCYASTMPTMQCASSLTGHTIEYSGIASPSLLVAVRRAHWCSLDWQHSFSLVLGWHKLTQQWYRM
jgi:hypothetical protein